MNKCRCGDPFSEVIYLPPDLVQASVNKNHPLHNKIIDAINIFKWQKSKDTHRITKDPFDEITYEFHHWGVCNTLDKSFVWYSKRSVYKRYYCIFDSDKDFNDAMHMLSPEKPYTWRWKYNDAIPGYEVTSHGDRRYSPFFQFCYGPCCGDPLMSLEDYYKKYLKPYYEKHETPPVRGHQLMWNYMMDHKGLLFELAIIGRSGNFTDMFDKDGGQNKWYAEMLNQYYGLSWL